MKRNHRRAAIAAFIVTVIVLGGFVGCLLADANTAQMTFGTHAEALVKTEHPTAFPLPSWIQSAVPVGWRIVWWWVQTERDTVAYWFKNTDFQAKIGVFLLVFAENMW